MATLHGAPLPEDFKAGDPLTADDFNAVKDYWVVDELPEDAVDGDVVFVIGDSPVGGNELPGLGGWAEITDVSGSPKRYAYKDGIDWVAFEWTQDGSVTTTDGLVDALVVAAGLTGKRVTGAAPVAGNVLPAMQYLTAAEHMLTVGKVNANAGDNSGMSQLGVVSARITVQTQNAGPGGTHIGAGATAPSDGAGIHSNITGSDVEYGMASGSGDQGSIPADTVKTTPGSANDVSLGPGIDGVVIVRVPAALTEKVDPGKWVTRSNNFAVVENGVVTETYTEHHYGNGTTTPLPQTDLIPCDANVTEGYSYENGEFVAPPALEIPAAQQEILDKINELQQELRSYDV